MGRVGPRKDILRLVARRQGVADKKSAMPVLANVLLVAEGNTQRSAGSDLHLSTVPHSGPHDQEVLTCKK